jgi:hypothetical protein
VLVREMNKQEYDSIEAPDEWVVAENQNARLLTLRTIAITPA